ncbi:MAG: LacI family DNA-binding transcriptional regulator [Caldilineaceae bacterium]
MTTHQSPDTPSAPSMRDVAKAAGVSLSTVSLVVNNKPGIGEETRARVLDVMAEMGYVPERRRSNGVTTNKVFGLLMESLTVPSSDERLLPAGSGRHRGAAYRLDHHLLLHSTAPNVDPLDGIRLMGATSMG